MLAYFTITIMSDNFYSKYSVEVDRFIKHSLEEDIETGDHSSSACLDRDKFKTGHLLVKEPCVIAGISLAEKIFKQCDPGLTLEKYFEEGSELDKGEIVFSVTGKAKSILATERLVLNCMQRMSGIASLTKSLTYKIAHTNCKILDTRKTTPGFRYPEKWAVILGGGHNHRMGLFDTIMIKDNHIDFCGGMKKTLEKTKAYLEKNMLEIPVIVEVRDQNEIIETLDFPWVKRILLDNMNTQELIKSIKLINGYFPTEASGNITAENLVKIAETGVDYLSMGALTHSARNIDLSLKAL